MNRSSVSVNLGRYGPSAEATSVRLLKQGVLARLRQKDHTLWNPAPAEITDRLGWLQSPWTMRAHLGQIEAFVAGVRHEGFSCVLLLGMGGSSLAPDVFRKIFGVRDGYADLAVLDTTDPGAVLEFAGKLDLAKTLFIVSTKSGSTVETFSFMKYFFNLLSDRYGAQEAGRRFVAVTDPGSALAELAHQHKFRETFLNDPEIGGRYSALSFFGLVPAALIGMDTAELLQRAAAEAKQLAAGAADEAPCGLYLGAIIGELAALGRDKLTFIFSPQIAAFGDWLEQLIAESTGKQGKGILPIVGEPLGHEKLYGDDRLFVYVHLAGEKTHHGAVSCLKQAGQPVLEIKLNDIYDIGGQIFAWETATAVAGHILGVNPFDQPDVEAAKTLARNVLARYREKGGFPEETPALSCEGFDVYGDIAVRNIKDALEAFINQASPQGYVALQAYLKPDAAKDTALLHLRRILRERCRLATTAGYGPRYLHSTGQLHKGDGGHGIFIQFTADDDGDAAIPDEIGRPGSSITFGMLKSAQAMGDRQALRSAGRKILRFHLKGDSVYGLRIVADALAGGSNEDQQCGSNAGDGPLCRRATRHSGDDADGKRRPGGRIGAFAGNRHREP